MVEVPEELRHKYHHKRSPYPTDALIASLDDTALLKHMGVPPRFHEGALAEQDWHNTIEAWIEQLPFIFRPQHEQNHQKPDLMSTGLAFYGPSGSGKTTTAAALLLRLVRRLVPNADPDGDTRWYGAAMGGFVSWQEFSRMAREKTGGDDNADVEYNKMALLMYPSGPMLTRGDWLVVDDISRERATEFNLGELSYFLRRRYDWGYPTIITTNTPPQDWAKQYGEVMGNFMARCLIPVEFTKDRE